MRRHALALIVVCCSRLIAGDDERVAMAIEQLRSKRSEERANGAETLRNIGKGSVKELRAFIDDVQTPLKSRVLAFHTLERCADDLEIIDAAGAVFWSDHTELSNAAREVLIDTLKHKPALLRKVIPVWDKNLVRALADELRPGAAELLPLFRDILFLEEHRVNTFALELLTTVKDGPKVPRATGCMPPFSVSQTRGIRLMHRETKHGEITIVHDFVNIDQRWPVGGLLVHLNDTRAAVRLRAVELLEDESDAEGFVEAGLLFAIKDEDAVVKIAAELALVKRAAAAKEKRD